MRARWASIVLWLFVINLGIAFGAGLYESRVVIPRWEDMPRHAWPNTGLLFWVYVTTVPLTLLTLLNLAAAWTDSSIRRKWWLTAGAIIALERIVTFAYFIPAMVGLMGSELPGSAVKTGLTQWMFFNNGRHVLTLSGWLLALKALSLPGELRG